MRQCYSVLHHSHIKPAHLVHCKATRGSVGVAEPNPIGHVATVFPEAASSPAVLPKPYGQLVLAKDCVAPPSSFAEAVWA